MKFASTYVGVLAGLLLLPAFPAPAQGEHYDEEYRSASLVGAPGLFMTWDAETLGGGEVSAGLGFSYYNRDPGRLMLRQLPVAFAITLSRVTEIRSSEESFKEKSPGNRILRPDRIGVTRFFANRGFQVTGIDNNQRAFFFGPEGDTGWILSSLRKEIPGYCHHAIDIRDREAVRSV